jgi:hypothetical protein
MPFERAVTQLNLGMALADLGERTRNRKSIERGYAITQEAVEVFSKLGAQHQAQMANGQVDHLKLALSQYDAQSR